MTYQRPKSPSTNKPTSLPRFRYIRDSTHAFSIILSVYTVFQETGSQSRSCVAVPVVAYFEKSPQDQVTEQILETVRPVTGGAIGRQCHDKRGDKSNCI